MFFLDLAILAYFKAGNLSHCTDQRNVRINKIYEYKINTYCTKGQKTSLLWFSLSCSTLNRFQLFMMLNAHGLDGPSESKFCYYKRTLLLTKLIWAITVILFMPVGLLSFL